jgi:hypothetical protein
MQRLATLALGPVIVCLAACGSRSTLDDGDLLLAGATGGGGAGGAAGRGGGGGGSTAGRGGAGGLVFPPIGGLDGGFVLPGLDASIGQACMDCVVGQCPTVSACATDTACRTGVLCTVTTCSADGGLGNLACVAKCFGGNLQLALSAMTGITCVTQGCGPTCGLGP